jgi:succinate-semialdehyde dehydrogenase/glutarate-semialdehyde dehydrogenase
MQQESIDPTSGEIWQRFDNDSDATIETKLKQAAEAQEVARVSSFESRRRLLERIAELLELESSQHASLITREMGKPIRSARDEVAKCASACRYYAEHAERLLQSENIDGPSHRVRYDPLGTILAVMPWNFPYWQVFRFAAPAIAAGNVALVKHASNVPSCATQLASLFSRAGAARGLFQVLLVPSEKVPGIVADDRVAAVTLTGSDAAGRAVGACSGMNLKKSVLELGGSDAFIVLGSADLDRAVATAVKAKIINNGQSCIAAKRFIVVDAVYERFLRAFTDAMRKLRVGDPNLEDTDVGPLATRRIRDTVAAQVDDLIAKGATLHLGGSAAFDAASNFYAPTILGNLPSDSRTSREEIFGPVALVFRATHAAQALALANDSPFGLAASVWTREPSEMADFERDLNVGSVFVNAMVASDPRFPFGGVKQSGYGRELGIAGLREFVNTKTVRRWS